MRSVVPCSCVPRLLQHENEELRRRLTYVTNKMEAMERELESGQDYLEMELGQNREELEKFKDKFRRYGKEKRGTELERSLPPRTPSSGLSGLCPVAFIGGVLHPQKGAPPDCGEGKSFTTIASSRVQRRRTLLA